MKKLELYGDSILKGVVYQSDVGRYRLCRSPRLTALEDDGVAVCNHSRMGATIHRGVRSLERQGPCSEDTLVVLEYGGNDCDYNWAEIAANPEGTFLPHTPEKAFLAGYRNAVEMARRKGAQVAMLSLIPIDAEKYFSWISRSLNKENILRWLGDVSMLSRWQEYYNHLVEGLAKSMGCPLIDVRRDFLMSHQFGSLLCDDGIHPTPAGHDLITGHIASFFQTV